MLARHSSTSASARTLERSRALLPRVASSRGLVVADGRVVSRCKLALASLASGSTVAIGGKMASRTIIAWSQIARQARMKMFTFQLSAVVIQHLVLPAIDTLHIGTSAEQPTLLWSEHVFYWLPHVRYHSTQSRITSWLPAYRHVPTRCCGACKPRKREKRCGSSLCKAGVMNRLGQALKHDQC
jgi:hypothetical protein